MADSVSVHDVTGLMQHIEQRYDAGHREQLPEHADLASKVERVHAGHAGAPAGLAEILRRLTGRLEVHMKKQELILFPSMRKGGGPGIQHPIAVMRADRDGHDRDVAEIRRITGGSTVPDGACRSWRALCAGLDEFMTDLAEHMRLENDILFPMFEPGRRANASGAIERWRSRRVASACSTTCGSGSS